MPTNHKNSSNIFEAAQNNDEKFIKYFVEEKCVPVTTTNALGMTAAHIAASKGNRTILKYLIEKDATLVEMKDRWQQTALLMAVGRGALDVVEYLVETCNANIFQTSYVLHFNGVLHIAAEAGHLEVLKYFVEKRKMDVNNRNSAGQPPAFLAASNDHVHIVEYFVDKTVADLTVVDNEDRTILHLSALKGFLSVPKLLLDQKKIPIDVNHQDNLGRTILKVACSLGHIDFVKYLVEKKLVNINQADNLGWTPLHQVAFEGNLELVRYLVEHKADLTIQDPHGKTVMDLATTANVTKYLRGTAAAVQNRTRRSYKVQADEFFFPKSLANKAGHTAAQMNITKDTSSKIVRLIDSNSFAHPNSYHDLTPLLIFANALLRLFPHSVKSPLVEFSYDSVQNNINSIITGTADLVFNKKFENEFFPAK